MAIRVITIDEELINAGGTARVNRAMSSVFGPSGQYIVKASNVVNGKVRLRSKSKEAR
jgi:hypothetical protein